MTSSINLDLVNAVNTIRQSKRWLVLVCPNDDQLMVYRKGLSAALTSEDRFSGRTAKLAGGGKISIVNQAEDPFHPDGESILVQFMGMWRTATDRMKVWRKAANEVL